MSKFKKLLDDYFTTSGRLSGRGYTKLLARLWLPLAITLFLEWLIVDALGLGARFPHVVFAVRAVMYTTAIFFWVTLPFYSTRRLHDIGKSGWWMVPLFLMAFSPIPGSGLLTFAFGCWLIYKKGDEGANKYGEPPPDD